MKDLMFMLVCGIGMGVSGTQLYNNLRYTTFNVPAYQVGDCISNGLFFEQIVEIRKKKYTSAALYVTKYYQNGRLTQVGTTETWIADTSYVKVNPENCKERK